MSQLYEERDLYKKATYSLAVKVTLWHSARQMTFVFTFILKVFDIQISQKSKYLTYFFQIIKINKLNLVRRLHISEQTWAKTADHFTVLLTEKVLKLPNISFCQDFGM